MKCIEFQLHTVGAVLIDETRVFKLFFFTVGFEYWSQLWALSWLIHCFGKTYMVIQEPQNLVLPFSQNAFP